LLYLVTFFFLLPERIPTTILPIAIIIGFYAFIFVVLKMTNQIDEKIIKKATNIDIYDAQFFFKFFGLFLALSILYCLIPIIGIIVAFLIFLSLFIIGPIIFLLVLIKTLKK